MSISHKDLVRDLRKAITHLDDTPYLESLPLAQSALLPMRAGHYSKGQELCRLVRLAIDALAPVAGDTASDALESRAYQILYLHAISKKSMLAIADQIGLGERQAYRELRRSVDALARVVARLIEVQEQETSHSPEGVPLADPADGLINRAVHRLEMPEGQDVNLLWMLEDVMRIAKPLVEKRDLDLRLGAGAKAVYVWCNRVMFRQVLLNAISHVIRAHKGNVATLYVERAGDLGLVRLPYFPDHFEGPAEPKEPRAIAERLAQALGYSWQHTSYGDGSAEIQIRIPLIRERNLLIIDDNEDYIALFRRYLRNQPYRVYGATSIAQAFGIAQTAIPDIIILDIMMPDQDGWEVLSQLGDLEATKQALVVVCSIIDDPEFATALGAAAFLNKPVTQEDLILTLRRLTEIR